MTSACVKFSWLTHVQLLYCHKLTALALISAILLSEYTFLLIVPVALFAVVVILIFITPLSITLQNRGILLLRRSFYVSQVDTKGTHNTAGVEELIVILLGCAIMFFF